MPLAELLELDDDDLEVIGEECRAATWTQDTELLASILEMLAGVLARLNAGVPVVMQEKTGKVKPVRVPRPDWLLPGEPAVTVVTPAEMFRRFRS